MRRGIIIIVGAALALAIGACSLFTDLGGFDDGVDASSDAPALDRAASPPSDIDAGIDAEPFVTPDAALDACPTVTPADGLVAFYPLDEGQGTTVTDCSRSGLHGKLLGSPASMKWVPGRSSASGTALDLDGQGACFDMGAGTQLEFAMKSFTVSAWIKVRVFEDSANLSRQVFSRENVSGASRGWHLGTDDPSSVELDVITPDGGQREISTPIAANTWTHVAVTFDGGMKVYVNGLLKNTNPGPHVLAFAANGAVRLGCKSVGDKGFDGAVDDLRVYSRVLTGTEISSLAQQ